MNIIFDEKDLAKLNTEGMEKLADIISAVANADSVAEKVAEHIGCTEPVTATPEAIEEDRKRTAKKNRAKKNAKEPEPAEEETDDVEIGGTEEEFDRATVLKAIQSLCSTDGQVAIGNRSLNLILGKSRKINHQLISILLLFDIGLHNPSGFLTVKLLFGIIHFFIHIIKWKLIKPVIK